MTMNDIEKLTRAFSARRDYLAAKVAELEAELAEVKRRRLAAIKRAVSDTADAQAQLRIALSSAPQLFDKPKTRVFSGVRVGYTKQRGQVVIEDEEAVIRRIRQQLPKDQADLLIRVRESVHKPAVYDLTAGDLKRLGIRVEDDEVTIMIKPVDGEVDRLVNALLREAEQVEDAAA